MRIISQDGTFDLPYELAVVYKKDCEIHANIFGSHDVIGKYSSQEKVEEVLGDLRNAYRNQKSAFYFPEDDEVSIDET